MVSTYTNAKGEFVAEVRKVGDDCYTVQTASETLTYDTASEAEQTAQFLVEDSEGLYE